MLMFVYLFFSSKLFTYIVEINVFTAVISNMSRWRDIIIGNFTI